MNNNFRREIEEELIELGYNKHDIINCINDINERLKWNVNSLCSIYSRKNKQWFGGEIITVFIHQKTNEKWLTVRYNNKNTKNIQRFNPNIKPIDFKSNEYNEKIFKYISNKFRPNIIKYIYHFTLLQAKRLKVNDKIDHRDQHGQFFYGTVIQKVGTTIKIHYDGWDHSFDEWSDYRKALYRFAKPGSISKRKAHRFTELKKGDFIDINPTRTDPGWKPAEIHRLEHSCGQIRVSYWNGNKDVLYWTHLDDTNEIAAFGSKSGSDNVELFKSRLRERKFPREPHEVINNPYNINDIVDFQDQHDMKWYEARVIDRENNWIILQFDGYGYEFDQKCHVIDDREKLSNVWYKKLSFDILRSKGLINYYAEWKSVKNAFIMDVDDALKWMKLQQKAFRISLCSYSLITGYTKYCGDMPSDIQRIIILFCNYMFIKLVYNMKGDIFEYRALDTNMTVRDLAKMLEIEKGLDVENKDAIYSNFIHIWCQYQCLHDIYPVNMNNNDNKIKYSKNEKRWIEIPDDCMQLTLIQLDNYLDYNKILQIGVDIAKTDNYLCEEWSFKPKKTNKSKSKWMSSLKIGDIIDVFSDARIWRLGSIQNIVGSSYYIHYIGLHENYDEIIEIKNWHSCSSRLCKRYSYWLKPIRPIKSNKKVIKLKFCWTTNNNIQRIFI